MIRTRALELQGIRAGGAWKVRLGAGIPSVSVIPMLTADKPKGSSYAMLCWALIRSRPDKLQDPPDFRLDAPLSNKRNNGERTQLY